MSCELDTASIALSIAAGQLSADLVVDPGVGLAPNPLVVNPAGVYVVGTDGWIPIPATLAFSSADGHTFVATTSIDLRSFVGVGDKIRVVQSGVPAYFIVTAIALGTITLYGGQLYTLAATPVTLPYFSKAKSPVGFTLDPTQWTEQLKDTSDRTQISPSGSTWYNPGSLSLAIPIGAWITDWSAELFPISAGTVSQTATLSTANNSESDPDFTADMYIQTVTQAQATMGRSKTLLLAAKTSYFLNTKARVAANSITFQGSVVPTFIRARCAYL